MSGDRDGATHVPAFSVFVDGRKPVPLRRIWRFIGYDEVNYTYAPGGRDLLATIGSLPDSPYYVRTHFLLCSGDGTGSPKWGSTNVYTVDEQGVVRLDWTVWDKVFDTLIESACIPFLELGFTPEALPAETGRRNPQFKNL